MNAKSLLLATALLPLGGCALFGITSKVDVQHELTVLESGVKYREILPGEGPPVELGQEVTVDYTGFLSDGSVFDSSIDRGFPIEFVLGEAPIAGWNEGILGMQAGGRRHVSIPPELAYGAAGVEGLIPPDEVLVFEFELLEIR
jgi:FKBP-type peptidyl-prolyl cis-trans isomerase